MGAGFPLTETATGPALDMDRDSEQSGTARKVPAHRKNPAGHRSTSATTLRRKERELAAYRLWMELQSFTKVGDHYGFGRQYARQLVLGGWRIEVRTNREARFPGRRIPRRDSPTLVGPMDVPFQFPTPRVVDGWRG